MKKFHPNWTRLGMQEGVQQMHQPTLRNSGLAGGAAGHRYWRLHELPFTFTLLLDVAHSHHQGSLLSTGLLTARLCLQHHILPL